MAKQKFYETAKPQETAVLVAVPAYRQTDEQTDEYLDELAFLTETAGAQTIKRFIQKLERPDRATFVGSGKLDEIKAYVQEHNVDMVIFDDDLSPSQVRNIERELQIKIVDRSLLILDIFALRAKTAQAHAQVEMAQYQYLLPRLTNLWTHLSKQKGGIGMKGPGETEIETDRRIVREKITLLKERLKKFEKQNFEQRKSRAAMVRVALVGYTNVGKSTIMNLLSKSEVFAENKLFATVDATVRKVVFDNIPFLLSDTVGFIRKLPTKLIESFKSTLDEIREADLLVHVVDVSHPSFEEHIEVVNDTLKDINAAEKPVLLVFNKVDLYLKKREQEMQEEGHETLPSIEDLKATYMAKIHAPALFISATNKINIEGLREELHRRVAEIHYERYPNNV
ncbi:GTPase HflX [Pontibacter sp. BT310]|jgi:GTPase|uniref:GTPase HflX n=1 Tax=Pontibacter populi TaxID=890055 RepID=A0ABS6XHU9_9BACT|nr:MULTISPECIES: GTPase HflX [Pontibacter]MBJ6119932.1 GTPase HflX [Pontibacter sp. BT310]MBR0572361.1 GTPase HflX [Microvirga sp. STS03]MBW3366785.1 GTPase HflX [Pontibacter populi]